MKHFKNFRSFLNESAFPEKIKWSREFGADWSTLRDMADEFEEDDSWDDSPEKEAAEAILSDSGCNAEAISYMGSIDKRREQLSGGTLVPAPGGYPGALTVEKWVEGQRLYYVMRGEDFDTVWFCVK